MRKIAVGDIMTRNFISVKPETNILECARAMVKNRVGSLLIISEKKLVGILTERDILWAITKKPGMNLKEVKAIDVSTRKIAVIKPSTDLNMAFIKMKRLNLRRLPVIAKGEVVGMLTLRDILRIEPELYSEAGELERIREESEKLKQSSEIVPIEGLCENCGAFSELLKVENRMLCYDCRDEMY